MIQAYEQVDQDIMKAEARTVFALTRMLGCSAEVICGRFRPHSFAEWILMVFLFSQLLRIMGHKYSKDWNPLFEKGVAPRVLLIGHDPRLQLSDTIAEYALFSNYYFEEVPKNRVDKRKFGLAEKSFEQILDITNHRFRADEIYVTNLCNESLVHAPQGKTVLIPENVAKEGYERIATIIYKYKTIEFIFPMSQQVNYWLQHFGLYQTPTDFMNKAKPKQKGIDNNPPYYEAVKQRDHPFLEICGNVYNLNTGQKLIPVLHTKQYGRLVTYSHCYEQIRKFFGS